MKTKNLAQYFKSQLEQNSNIQLVYTKSDRVVVCVLDDSPQAIQQIVGTVSFSKSDVEFRKVDEPFKAYADPGDNYRPAPGGVSIGHPNISAGTLGAWVRDANGDTCLLTNNHVAADTNRATIGDNTLQPGKATGGVNPRDTIANLSAFIRIVSGATNKVDCAIAKVRNPSDVDLRYLTSREYLYGHPIPAYVNMLVEKEGLRTGRTRGSIEAIDGAGTINYGSAGNFRFNDLLVSETLESGPGDSGSKVRCFSSGFPVGLLFAGGNGLTILCKATNVFDALQISVIQPPSIEQSWWPDASHWNAPIEEYQYFTYQDTDYYYLSQEFIETHTKSNLPNLTAFTFSTLRDLGAEGMYFKACQGRDLVDREFLKYLDASKGILKQGAYIFVDPAFSAKEHFDNFLRVIGNRRLDAALDLDCEFVNGQNPQTITSVIENLAEMASDWSGKPCSIYTSPYFWDTYVLPSSNHKKYHLDLALWTKTAFFPAILPKDWAGAPGEPISWQHDVTTGVPGVGSKALDNRKTFKGFREVLGPPPPPLPTKKLTITIVGQGFVSPAGGDYPENQTVRLTATPNPGYIFSAWAGDVVSSENPVSVLMDTDKYIICEFASAGNIAKFTYNKGVTLVNLNYRTGAGTGFTRLGTMPIGTVVPILGFSNDANGNPFANIGFKEFAAFTWNGTPYIRFVMEGETIAQAEWFIFGEKASWINRIVEKLFYRGAKG